MKDADSEFFTLEIIAMCRENRPSSMLLFWRRRKSKSVKLAEALMMDRDGLCLR